MDVVISRCNRKMARQLNAEADLLSKHKSFFVAIFIINKSTSGNSIVALIARILDNIHEIVRLDHR